MSSQEIALVIDLQTKSGALKRSLKQLLAQELIEYSLPDKPNSRLQKYRLTANGRALLLPHS
jgi:DNA-binding MarR family transcriptional regulator